MLTKLSPPIGKSVELGQGSLGPMPASMPGHLLVASPLTRGPKLDIRQVGPLNRFSRQVNKFRKRPAELTAGSTRRCCATVQCPSVSPERCRCFFSKPSTRLRLLRFPSWGGGGRPIPARLPGHLPLKSGRQMDLPACVAPLPAAQKQPARVPAPSSPSPRLLPFRAEGLGIDRSVAGTRPPSCSCVGLPLAS